MTQTGRSAKGVTGSTSYHSGLSAEQQVAERYAQAGAHWHEHRWRGSAGEIDLIFEKDDTLVFVEVKSSRSFDGALNSFRSRQVARVCQTAEEFAGRFGEPREIRLDLALVNGAGQIRTLENVLAMG